MKAFLLSSFLISSTGFAQNIEVADLKKMMTGRQVLLESINPGMSKKVTNQGSFLTEDGEECAYSSTAIQTILKVQGDNLIILSRESFIPDSSPECIKANAQAYEERILFYEQKPMLALELEAIDQAAQNLSSLSQNRNIITMKLNLAEELEDGTLVTDQVTVKYDLSLPSFKNMILNEGTGYSVTTVDVADIEPKSADLSDVLFCENNDGDTAECVQGNYSDILF